MRLGDNPEIRKQLGGTSDGGASDGTECPQCGGRKKPEFAVCYDCHQRQRSGGQPPRGGNTAAADPPSTLPRECVFDTFYGADGKLRRELFYNAPQQLAAILKTAQLKPHALRLLYQGFLSFAAPLRDNRLDFETARERFGIFYVERVIRQAQRGFLPPLMKDFVDAHRDLALKSREEMLGLFRYLTNVLCYFGDKD